MKFLRKFNESFNNEAEFKEALEIYIEDLPFEMYDGNIEIQTTGTLPEVKEKYKRYIIHYTHVDDSLKYLVPLVHQPGIFEEDPDDIEEAFDLTKVHNKVYDDVNAAFTRFAKKYDLIYEEDKIIVDAEFDDDIVPLDWSTDTDEIKLLILVKVELKQLL